MIIREFWWCEKNPGDIIMMQIKILHKLIFGKKIPSKKEKTKNKRIT